MANTSATYEEVKAFLDQMKTWLRFLNGKVFYEVKPKNTQFMADMEWTKESEKKEWLLKLKPEDYFEGPDPNERQGFNPVWKFGKRIEGKLCECLLYIVPSCRT